MIPTLPASVLARASAAVLVPTLKITLLPEFWLRRTALSPRKRMLSRGSVLYPNIYMTGFGASLKGVGYRSNA